MCFTATTVDLPTKEVAELPGCQFCAEQANIQTTEGMEINLCGIDNHPDYAGVSMVRLVLKTTE